MPTPPSSSFLYSSATLPAIEGIALLIMSFVFVFLLATEYREEGKGIALAIDPSGSALYRPERITAGRHTQTHAAAFFLLLELLRRLVCVCVCVKNESG